MVDLFSGVEAFVAVAEEGSFRAAAARLGVTPGAVSRAVAGLERDVGARLLNRTTRRVATTAEGQVLLVGGREAIDALREARRLIELSQGAARGPLHVSLSPVIGGFVTSRLSRFRERYPAIELHLHFGDAFTSLVEEGVDVAIRIGRLEDSTLRSRRIMNARWVTIATRSYLAKHGHPRHPGELDQHACVRFSSPRGGLVEWVFLETPGGRRTITMDPPPALVTNLGPQILEAVRYDLGIGQVFDFMAASAIDSGEVVELLGAYAPPGPPVHALTMPGPQQTPRVQAFVGFMAEG